MKNELVSVIIPVYKVQKYLNRCISSVVSQTYTHLEIILVDDGSPDDCGIICDRWAEKDFRIKVIHKKNGGLSSARNEGINIANGSYFAFVDSDDYINPNMIKELLLAIQSTDSDIAECNYKYVYNCEEIEYQEQNVDRIQCCSTEKAIDCLLDEEIFKYTVWNKLYKKKIFNKLRFEENKLHEDVFFTYQAFAIAEKITKIEQVLYYYRQRQGSIMQEAFSVRSLDSLEARKRQYYFIKKNIGFLQEKAQVKVMESCLYFGQKVIKMDNKIEKKEAKRFVEKTYNDIFSWQLLKCKKKRAIWFVFAKCNFWGCCSVRNLLRIGR